MSPSQRGSYLAQHLLADGHPAKPDPSNRGQSDYHGTPPGFTLNFFVQDPEVRRFATAVRLAWDASSSTIRTLPLSVTPWSGGPGSSRRGGAIGKKSAWDVIVVLVFALAFALTEDDLPRDCFPPREGEPDRSLFPWTCSYGQSLSREQAPVFW